MLHNDLLSERLEDNKDAVKWARELQERRKKGDEIARQLMEKYTPIIMAGKLEQKA